MVLRWSVAAWLDQGHGPEMVGRGVARCCRGHVAHHQVGRAGKGGAQALRRLRLAHVADEKVRPGEGLDRLQVDADHLTPGHLPSGPRERDLGPAAGRRAQVEHQGATPDEAQLVVHLGQLEGGARPVAAALGFLHIGVAELALQPARRGGAAPLGGADLLFQAAPGKPAGGRAAAPALGPSLPAAAHATGATAHDAGAQGLARTAPATGAWAAP
jgi:hypothetical protein